MTARGYVICGHPRCGSNYLCQLLDSTGTLGHPQDWFNGPGIRAREDASYPLSPREQLEQVRLRGMTANGVYGLKMFGTGFDRMAGLDWATALPGLQWVHLERLDLLGQAISDVRALQTGQYRSTGRPRGEPRFDARAIRESLGRIARDIARWKLFFGHNGIAPLHLTYEGVVSAPQAAVDAVGALAGAPGSHPIQTLRVSLEVQRDAVSDQWRQEFLSREKDLSRLEALPSAISLWALRQLSRLGKGTSRD